MADTDVTVQFGADTSRLNAAVNQARQTVASFAPQTTGQATASLNDLRAAMDRNTAAINAQTTGWRANLAAAANAITVYRGLEAAIEDFVSVDVATFGILARSIGAIEGTSIVAARNEIGRLGDVVKATTAAAAAAPTAFDSYAASLVYGTGVTRSFITEQEGISATIGRAVLSVDKFLTEIRLGQTDLAKTELAAISAAGGLSAFAKAIPAGTLKDTLQDFTAELLRIPGITDQAAAEIEGMLGSIPNYSAEANDGLVRLIATISANGDAAVANAKAITAALGDDSAAGGQNMAAAVGAIIDGLNDGSLSAEQFARKMQDVNTLTAFFGKTLQPEAAAAYFASITSRLKAMADTQRATSAENEASLKRAGILGDAIALTRRNQVEIEKERVAQLEKAVDLLGKEKAVVDGIAAAQSRETAFRDTLEKANPINSQIDEVSGKITVLQNKLSRGSGDAPKYDAQDIDTLVRAVIGEAGGESSAGQLAVAAVALNRLANGNFGDSLDKLLKAGNGAQFNTFLPSDPTGAQKVATESYQYQKTLQDVVLPMLQGQYKDPTGGALNFYNPDTTKPMNRFAMDDTVDIGHHRFGTAKNSPAAVPGLGDDEAESTLQAVQKLQDELRKLNELKEGGSATSKAELENAQATARGMDDQVEAAKRILSAKREELATVQKTGGTPQSEDTAAKAVFEAENSLREREMERTKASESLKTAALQEGSQERLNATLAELDQEQAGHAESSAKYLEIERQKVEAVKGFNKQEAANAVEVERLRYDAAVKGFAEQKTAIQNNAQVRGISAEQETAQLKVLADRQEAEDRAHFDRLRGIAKQFGTDSVAEARKTAQAEGEAAIKLGDERVKQTQAANQRVLESYKATAEQIGSNISSSIMGMIQGTTTLKGAMQSVAREIVQMFVQSRVKMVADWAAGEAQKLTTSTTFQAIQTQVAAAGEAARTGIAATGAAAAGAAKAPAMIASIEASANETYAGVFGFLSPVLGPFAAAPALAAEALVMAKSALPSFAQGSWSLPSDMVAQVHAGEMIVPAGPAAMMRAAAGGGGGQGGGGMTMGDMHFHINGADSPQKTMAHIRANLRPLLKDMREYMRTNPSVRF